MTKGENGDLGCHPDRESNTVEERLERCSEDLHTMGLAMRWQLDAMGRSGSSRAAADKDL